MNRSHQKNLEDWHAMSYPWKLYSWSWVMLLLGISLLITAYVYKARENNGRYNGKLNLNLMIIFGLIFLTISLTNFFVIFPSFGWF